MRFVSARRARLLLLAVTVAIFSALFAWMLAYPAPAVPQLEPERETVAPPSPLPDHLHLPPPMA